MTVNELILFEKKYQLWENKLFGYPLWIHCREPLLYGDAMVNRKIIKPKISSMLKSMFLTLKFLITQYKYEKVYCLMERTELLEIYRHDKSDKKVLFLNREQEPVYDKKDYISSDFFNLLRFVSRKVAFRIFKRKYQNAIKKLQEIGYEKELIPYVRVAMGDAFFLKFLKVILSNKSEKYYTGSIIPMGEKFVNSLNSYEVQHGVIHSEHIGYVGIPEVKNTLILYSERYVKSMRKDGYVGSLKVNEYKKNFLEKKSNRYFPIVIYSQPNLGMSDDIQNFFDTHAPKDCFIQKHPKDYFDYKIDEKYFVTGTTPLEVGSPILYTSSIVENFTIYNRDLYIHDLKFHDDVEAFLKIYTSGTTSKVFIEDSLHLLYEKIQRKNES